MSLALKIVLAELRTSERSRPSEKTDPVKERSCKYFEGTADERRIHHGWRK